MSSPESIQSAKVRTTTTTRKKTFIDTSYLYNLITQGK